MEQILYEIAGTKYLLVEVVLTDSTRAKLERLLTKYNCITQGVKELKKSWLGGHTILKWLVPENNVVNFNNEYNA